ncbi:hypothetical protein NIES4075_45220 [Tolypothrix sp. NIES-4075]|uniref:hypothetical protein n=1 Tax=Tolypothrix sp. NIES-4075 TaxID=2005459 RepID=UPI000B5C8FEF|nr:hypothetical protein [Tolypothrix sp. NIES-4075]GAX43507.1 hypothetical protein NIES4075_45220 [Tolypothrix sp. NIES-4075]
MGNGEWVMGNREWGMEKRIIVASLLGVGCGVWGILENSEHSAQCVQLGLRPHRNSLVSSFTVGSESPSNRNLQPAPRATPHPVQLPILNF